MAESHHLDAIKAACHDLLDDSEDEPLAARRAAYCSIVDPLSVLELVRFRENNGQTVTPEEWQAIGDLLREMAEHLRTAQPDERGAELAQRAVQLLDLTGL